MTALSKASRERSSLSKSAQSGTFGSLSKASRELSSLSGSAQSGNAVSLKVISSHIIIRMQSQQLKDRLKLLYRRPPTVVNADRIYKLYDLPYVQELERTYDDFIELNQHSLTLYDLIDCILDIRDAIIIRRCQLQRYYVVS